MDAKDSFIYSVAKVGTSHGLLVHNYIQMHKINFKKRRKKRMNKSIEKGVYNLFFPLHIWQKKNFPSTFPKFVPTGVKRWHKFSEV